MARAASPQRRWMFTVFAWLVALLIFFPILWTILTAFKTEGAVAPDTIIHDREAA